MMRLRQYFLTKRIANFINGIGKRSSSLQRPPRGILVSPKQRYTNESSYNFARMPSNPACTPLDAKPIKKPAVMRAFGHA